MTAARLPLATADYIVVFGYFVLVLWIGLWFRRKLSNVSDYFSGGHQIPWWMAGISHYMSSFSAFSFIAYAQIGYMYGWVAVTLFWASIPGCVAGGLLFARRWRRARVITPVEFLESRYNSVVRQTFAWAGIPMKIFDDALKVFATGVFVSVCTGISLVWSIIVCGAVMLAYTFFGGLWALVVTDYIQFLMKGLAILMMVPLAVRAAGGLHAGLSGLPAGFLAPTHQPYGSVYVLGFVAVMFVSYNASWSLAQKYYSVPGERDAAKAAYLSAALNLVGAPLMILPAILARHFLPDLAATNHSADTYVLLVTRLLPEGMIGIILAAMFSATMAAVSADFNSIASVLTQDVYKRLIANSASEGSLLSFGRWSTFALGAITTALSVWIAFSHREALFGLMVTVFGVFMAPTLLPLLVGLTSKRVTAGGAITGFLCGLLSGAIMLSLKTWWRGAATIFGTPNAFEGASLLTNTVVTLISMFVGSALFRRGHEESSRFNTFWQKLETPVPSSQEQSGETAHGSLLYTSTFAVAAIIGIAGLFARSSVATEIDTGVCFALVLLTVAARVSFRKRNARRGKAHLPSA